MVQLGQLLSMLAAASMPAEMLVPPVSTPLLMPASTSVRLSVRGCVVRAASLNQTTPACTASGSRSSWSVSEMAKVFRASMWPSIEPDSSRTKTKRADRSLQKPGMRGGEGGKGGSGDGGAATNVTLPEEPSGEENKVICCQRPVHHAPFQPSP